MTPPLRRLQPVPDLADPAAEGEGIPGEPPPQDDPPSGLLANALADAMEDRGPIAHDPAGDAAVAEETLHAALAAIEDGDGTPADPAAPFLTMAERASKVAPIHGDKARLAPAELLRMIGATPAEGGAIASPEASGQEGERSAHRNDGANGGRSAAEAALEQLARAAWDAIRAGAVEQEPELRSCLVQLCSRLGPPEAPGPRFPGPVAL